MMESSLPHAVALTPSMPRQSSDRPFGEVLTDTLRQTLSGGVGLVNGLTLGSPIVSAAASQVGTVLPPGASGPVSSLGAAQPSRQGEAWDLLRAQEGMSREYLALQNEMQRESREFNALSNVLKARHDSAKAAINNIR